MLTSQVRTNKSSKTRAVKVPVMPKGVEHLYSLAIGPICLIVKVPVMPKGVEHCDGDCSISRAMTVKVPVMPKGVEHTASAQELGEPEDGESTCDAERR